MMPDGLSVGEPSLLEITDNQNSMGAADRQLQPIPSLILNNFFCKAKLIIKAPMNVFAVFVKSSVTNKPQYFYITYKISSFHF